jgi:hypothetical protein
MVAQIRFGEIALLAIDSCEVHTASRIEFKLPLDAPSGEIHFVSTLSYMPNSLAGTISVVEPTVAAVSPLDVTGGTIVTVTGTNLDLVQYVEMGGTRLMNITLVDADTYTQLSAECPASIAGGLLKVIAYNGTEVNYDASFNGITPVITDVAPLLLDPQGGTLQVDGTGMDAVSKVLVGELELTVSQHSATQIKAEYGSDIAAGQLKLVCSNGNELKGAELSLAIVTPAPDNNDVSTLQGGLIVISGNYLQDVVRLNFSNDAYIKESDFLSRSHWQIVARYPLSAPTGSNIAFTVRAFKDAAHTEFEDVQAGTIDVEKAIPADYLTVDFDNLMPVSSSTATIGSTLEASFNGSAYAQISGSLSADSVGYIVRGQRPDISSFVFYNSTLSFAFNMKEAPATGNTLRWYMRVNNENYYYVWNLAQYATLSAGWHRVDIPLSQFETADGTPLNDTAFKGSFSRLALITGSGTGNIDCCFDNIAYVSGDAKK